VTASSIKTDARRSGHAGPGAEHPPEAWVALLRGHATLTRQMDAVLRAKHELTLNEFEVLLHLARAKDERLRRVDLAKRLVVTQGGVTRLLAGLEKRELVERASCDEDARVVYACLTEVGRRRLQAALPTHREDVRRLFSDNFSDPELDDLADLLGRLSGGAILE
jgi:DNA-binding MarR family transcriptional regulator